MTTWNQRLVDSRPALFVSVIIALLIVKVGVTFTPLPPDPVDSFPIPRDTWSQLSYGLRTLAWIAQTADPNFYSAVGVVLAITAILAIAISCTAQLEPTAGRMAITVLILGPAGTVLLGNIGRHDTFVILGGLIIGLLGRNVYWAVTGALLFLLGNPEQSVLALGLLFVLSFTPVLRPWRAGSAWGLALVVPGTLGLAIAAHAAGVGTRLKYLPELLGNSIYGFFSNFSLSVYAGYAILWIFVGWFLVVSTRSWRLPIIALLVAAPFLVTMVTLDQTRVFVGITTATVTALVMATVTDIRKALTEFGVTNPLVWTVVIAAFLPALEVTSKHIVRPPFGWFFSHVLPLIF